MLGILIITSFCTSSSEECRIRISREYYSKMATPERRSELPNLKIEIENDLDEAMEIDDIGNNTEDKVSKEGPEEGELSDSKDTDTEVKTPVFGLVSTSNEPIWVLSMALLFTYKLIFVGMERISFYTFCFHRTERNAMKIKVERL